MPKITAYTLVRLVEGKIETSTYRDMDNLRTELAKYDDEADDVYLFASEAVPFARQTVVTVGAPRKRRASTTEPAKRKGGRPPGSKNKPKPVVVVAEDEVMA